MTESQYRHHEEQMEAAREEFSKLYAGLPPETEMEVWQMFLKTKSLNYAQHRKENGYV